MASKKNDPVLDMLVPGNKLSPSVARAREAFKARANEVLDNFMATAAQAAAAGDFETAAKIYQWLLEHAPEEDGVRVAEQSVDKKQQLDSRPTGPMIFIGPTVGATGQPTSRPMLPDVTVIEAEKLDE